MSRYAEDQGVVKYAQPCHVTLSRSAKGSYYWEISVHATTPAETLALVSECDIKLRREYGTEPPS